MSYDVALLDKDGQACKVESHEEGGTYVLGGNDRAELNVTYNYGGLIRAALHPDGLRWLHGKTAKETHQKLEVAVLTLGNTPDADYWATTQGNAGHALAILLGWGIEHPDGMWDVH